MRYASWWRWWPNAHPPRCTITDCRRRPALTITYKGRSYPYCERHYEMISHARAWPPR